MFLNENIVIFVGYVHREKESKILLLFTTFGKLFNDFLIKSYTGLGIKPKQK
ncbi:hypothetical protein [Acinetobacter defluvii]|uniref:hypothetical protein n=1 Tax=Acinetobacter defluvii TaxID=1871111 RepID=UPI00148EF916|nr:hypothetical protein [Acinetobacter defluvii]